MNFDCLQGKLGGQWNVAREGYGSTGSTFHGSRTSSTARHLSNPVDSCRSYWPCGTESAQGATPFFHSFRSAVRGLAPSSLATCAAASVSFLRLRPSNDYGTSPGTISISSPCCKVLGLAALRFGVSRFTVSQRNASNQAA